MTEDFIPVAARRRAAQVDLDGYEVPSMISPAVLAEGDVILDPNRLDRDLAVAVVAGPTTWHRDPDYVGVPVLGSDRQARIYTDTVTATGRAATDG